MGRPIDLAVRPTASIFCSDRSTSGRFAGRSPRTEVIHPGPDPPPSTLATATPTSLCCPRRRPPPYPIGAALGDRRWRFNRSIDNLLDRRQHETSPPPRWETRRSSPGKSPKTDRTRSPLAASLLLCSGCRLAPSVPALRRTDSLSKPGRPLRFRSPQAGWPSSRATCCTSLSPRPERFTTNTWSGRISRARRSA